MYVFCCWSSMHIISWILVHEHYIFELGICIFSKLITTKARFQGICEKCVRKFKRYLHGLSITQKIMFLGGKLTCSVHVQALLELWSLFVFNTWWWSYWYQERIAMQLWWFLCFFSWCTKYNVLVNKAYPVWILESPPSNSWLSPLIYLTFCLVVSEIP